MHIIYNIYDSRITPMKQLLLSFFINLSIIVVLLVGTALADPPDHDSYVDINEASNHNNEDLSVVGSTADCTPNRTTYMQWDLSNMSNSETVTAATLTLTSTQASNAGSAQISLYETDNNWTEDALDNANAPAVGTLIETVAAPVAGNSMTFSDPALATYIDSANGSVDDVVSFAMRISSGCPTFGVSLVDFEDSESGDQGPNLETTPPLAVTLANFGAISQPDHVLVDWQTVAELGNLGFNVLRSTSPEGAQTRLNAELIPSQAPGSGQGASYSFEDDDVEDGTTYYYRLEDVDTSGTTTRHGPVSVTYDSNPTAVQVIGLGNGSRGKPWANGLLGTLLLAAVGYVWYRRRRA